MNASHQRCFFVECWWQRNVLLLKLALGISKVKLVKHAVVPVLGQRLPVLLAESLSLVEEAMQIGLGANFLG